jgi:hypothetical protein
MSYIEKMLGIAGIGTTFVNVSTNVSILRQFMAGVTIVLALTAISCTLLGGLIAVGFYAFYLALVHYGLDADAALITVSSTAFLVILALGAIAAARWRELREMPKLLNIEMLGIGKAGRLVDAFLAGLSSGRRGRD